MSNKKGTLTSRTLEKLGFVASKFRSGSNSDELAQKESISGSEKSQSSINTITGGELDLPEKTPKKTLLGKLWGPKHGTEESSTTKSTFYVDSDPEPLVTGKPLVTLAAADSEPTPLQTLGPSLTTPVMLEKKKKVKPEGAFEYTVVDTDTIEKIAARFDTTPSELKKLNKLISSMIFSGQVIFVPDKDYVRVSTSSVTEPDKQPPSAPTEMPSDRPTMDIPLVKSANGPPAKVPGHVERQISTGSQQNGLDFEMVPHKLSEEEAAEVLDKECMERFIKLSVKHITDGQLYNQDPKQGVVKGVLLVTPNAVMFDPDVMDPLVIERGAEKYGMIAPMDIIISAAMYHDIATMKIRDKRQEDGAMYNKPVIYRDPNCPIHKHLPSDETDSNVKDISEIPENIRSKFEKSFSVCSCGGDDVFEGIKEAAYVDTVTGGVAEIDSRKLNDKGINGKDAKNTDNVTEDSKVSKDSDSHGDIETEHHEAIKVTKDSDSHGDIETEHGEAIKASGKDSGTKPNLTHVKGKRLSVSFSLPESDDVKVSSDKVVCDSGTITEETIELVGDGRGLDASGSDPSVRKDEDTDSAIGVDDEVSDLDFNTVKDTASDLVQFGDNDKKSDANSDQTLVKDSSTENGDRETRIGNIVYLPVTEDRNGEISVQSLEETQSTLSKLSEDEFKVELRSDLRSDSAHPEGETTPKTDETDGVDSETSPAESSDVVAGHSTGNPLTTSANATNASSSSATSSALGPFSPTPHINAFVNYATGFFQRHSSDSSIKDIKEMPGSTLSQENVGPRSADVPSVGVMHGVRKRVGKMSRHDNLADIEVESAVRLDEKSELFTMDYKRFAPRKSVFYPDPPLYLCLRLGTPQKTVFHNYSIESYGKQRKKSEYWFSIPREKVDHLYAFFVQWTPEIYGDEDELTAEKRGFVVIEDDEDEEGSLEMLDEHFGPNSEFQKDWEIISKIEADRRRSVVYHEPLPLPELIGQSVILDDEKISQLSQMMPGRTVGYPWTLIYSTETHGFSLKTLYREMNDLDSPILLAVKDINDNTFGALTSCELKISDSFYGTGETFLYTFHPEFKVFHWTGENNFFIKGNNESLSVGAGQGLFGLWLDGDIYHGRTNRCDTFDNDILTLSEDFIVKAFEAWAFIWE